MEFISLVVLVAFLSSALASVIVFGIGSLLTPLLAIKLGAKVSVAIVAIPHFVATIYRCWTLRKHIDSVILIRFGVLSAIGGLIGASLNCYATNMAISLVFGFLLIFAGATGVLGAQWFKFDRKVSMIAGALSGIFGGLVGNQGGIRSAALLGFSLSKEAFVATATAVGVMVDLARIPVYFLSESAQIQQNLSLIAVATLAVLIGTIFGMRCLKGIPEQWFRKAVSTAVAILGVVIIFRCLS